ncbi:MAG: ECF-type sigma factor [Planctomycetota bacterium]
MTDPTHHQSSSDERKSDVHFERMYDELRRLAAVRMRGEREGHSLDPTGLVHEVFLRAPKDGLEFENEERFLAYASRVMRSVLVDHARASKTQKRGGAHDRISLTGLAGPEDQSVTDVIALDEALKELEALDERRARILELRFFGGMTEAQVCSVLGIARSTASAEWRSARAWLLRRVRGGGSSD